MSFFRKSGIVNVKMVITEEKILSNIDKIQKLINPNSKKQIVQLEEDSYFKDLVESVKTYLIEYPRKKNFPAGVYKSAYDLVEYATNQFEENTKQIEGLIRKRERNIKLAGVLKDVTKAIKGRAKNWKEIIKKLEKKYSKDVIDALTIIGNSNDPESEEYQEASKTLDAKINNLEANLHIEIDMERIEDRSKALSYIGIEIAEALKYIPTPAEAFLKEDKEEFASQIIETEPKPTEPDKKKEIIVPEAVQQIEKNEDNNIDENRVTVELDDTEEIESEKEVEEVGTQESDANEIVEENQNSKSELIDNAFDNTFFEETRFDVKPSLWQRIKNSKIVKAISYIMHIKVVLDYPALPEGNTEK